jgi:fumarate hydratase subunit beta
MILRWCIDGRSSISLMLFDVNILVKRYTSYRMDAYSPSLIERGLKGMIGKGMRSDAVKEAMKKYKAVYFAATGGAGALLAKRIKKAHLVAYDDLGPEAIRMLELEDFPVIVVNDVRGYDLYTEGEKEYRRE